MGTSRAGKKGFFSFLQEDTMPQDENDSINEITKMGALGDHFSLFG